MVSTFALEMVRGDEFVFHFLVLNNILTVVANDFVSTPTARDVTSDTFKFTAKTSIDDLDSAAVSSLSSSSGIAIVDAATGHLKITIPASATNSLTTEPILICDIQMLDGGSTSKPKTVGMGTIAVVKDVTRLTS